MFRCFESAEVLSVDGHAVATSQEATMSLDGAGTNVVLLPAGKH